MRRTTLLWVLAVVNAALLVALAWRLGGENPAHAQLRPPVKAEILMMPGRLANSPNGVLYIVDTRNGLLGAFVYDNNRQDMVPMPPINLNRVFNPVPPR